MMNSPNSPDSPAPPEMVKTETVKDDGRILIFYTFPADGEESADV